MTQHLSATLYMESGAKQNHLTTVRKGEAAIVSYCSSCILSGFSEKRRSLEALCLTQVKRVF